SVRAVALLGEDTRSPGSLAMDHLPRKRTSWLQVERLCKTVWQIATRRVPIVVFDWISIWSGGQPKRRTSLPGLRTLGTYVSRDQTKLPRYREPILVWVRRHSRNALTVCGIPCNILALLKGWK